MNKQTRKVIYFVIVPLFLPSRTALLQANEPDSAYIFSYITMRDRHTKGDSCFSVSWPDDQILSNKSYTVRTKKK